MTDTASAAASLFDVSNLAAIVSGGAHGGLGHHSALVLAGLGARVMVTDHASRVDDLHRTADEIRKMGGNCVVETCDVDSESEVKDLVAVAMEEFGAINALAHHAGVMLRKDALETTRAEWEHVLSVNLTGTWLLNRAVARCMIEGEGGAIVNTSSIYANIVGSAAGVCLLRVQIWGRQSDAWTGDGVGAAPSPGSGPAGSGCHTSARARRTARVCER